MNPKIQNLINFIVLIIILLILYLRLTKTTLKETIIKIKNFFGDIDGK